MKRHQRREDGIHRIKGEVVYGWSLRGTNDAKIKIR